MQRFGVLFALALLTLGGAQTVAAAGCVFCVNAVAVQTRDGQAWVAGQPVTLVVRVAEKAEAPLPAAAQVVVMQTDGDRTKCLGVPLRLVQSDESGGVYAGLFFPFRAARFDGVLVVGSDVQSIAFDVNQMAPGAGPSGSLPEAERIDTSAPPLFPFMRSLPSWLPLVGG